MLKIKEWAKVACLVAAAVLIGVLAYHAAYGPAAIAAAIRSELAPLKVRLAERDDQVKEVLGNLQKASKTVMEAAEENYWDAKATAETTAAAARSTDELLRNANSALFGDRGLVPQLADLSVSLQRDTHDLTVGLQAPLGRLDESLKKVAALAATLEDQVGRNGKASEETLREALKALEDLDRLLADPEIHQTLANVQETTKSVDIALRPWREKASQLKFILGKLVGFFRVVLPL